MIKHDIYNTCTPIPQRENLRVVSAYYKGFFDGKADGAGNWINKGVGNVKNWQKDFSDYLRKSKNPLKVYAFEDKGLDSVWVIDNPELQNIYDYSDLYVSFLQENPDHYFDFMVHGASEIDENSLPKNFLEL